MSDMNSGRAAGGISRLVWLLAFILLVLWQLAVFSGAPISDDVCNGLPLNEMTIEEVNAVAALGKCYPP